VSEASSSRGGDLLNAIQSSRGMEHVNRSHQRTFSLNIFRMNALELIEITRRVSDPNEGLRLMSRDNLEAGKQTHREVTRRVHNFVAASLTLVEHTRIFMREHYTSTAILDRYQAKVNAEFADDPLVRFVQDLRNFMLHNGLPNSEMFLNFESNPDLPGSGGLTTGIRIRTAHLSAWTRWSHPARAFIEGSGEFLDIRTFAEAYTDKIVLFHDWLQGELDQFHRADLEDVRALQASFNQLGAPATPPPQSDAGVSETSKNTADEPERDFSFAPDRAAVIDAAAAELLKSVREIHLPAVRSDAFASERPVGATITRQDMIKAPLFWSKDVGGRRVFVFIYKDGGLFGFDEEKFAEMHTLAEGVLNSSWARRTLSRSFIEKVVVEWLQFKFSGAETRDLSETIAEASREAVQPLELWAPIAHLEVQAPFAIGPAEIATISKTMIDGLEKHALSSAPNQRDKLVLLFGNLRKDMQGLAAVVFKAAGEPLKIKEDGEAIARIAVGLLRFLSPAAANFPMVCANALVGSEVVPTSNLLILRDGKLASYTQTVLSTGLPDWRLSEAALRELRPALEAIGRLVRPEELSSFALAIRSSLLLFGTGTTFLNPIERLTYTLSSLEALLLRHSAEQVEFYVAERMGLLLSQNAAGREEIARNVREAYRLRARQDISPLAPQEIGSVATFLRHAHRVISIALDNVGKFKAVADFVVSVDHLKSQRDQSQE
jgi:hypothetical protein